MILKRPITQAHIPNKETHVFRYDYCIIQNKLLPEVQLLNLALPQNCEKPLLASSCLSFRIELGSHWTDFHKIWYVSIFRKPIEKIQVSIISDKNNRYFFYLNINQLDALNFIMSLFHASTCFEHMCSSSGGQNCTIQPLVSSHLQVAVRCTG